jgi:hypothetical protein
MRLPHRHLRRKLTKPTADTKVQTLFRRCEWMRCLRERIGRHTQQAKHAQRNGDRTPPYKKVALLTHFQQVTLN